LATANFDTYCTWHVAEGRCNCWIRIRLRLIQVNLAGIIVDNIWRASIGAFSSIRAAWIEHL